jgi:hypothetical protein
MRRAALGLALAGATAAAGLHAVRAARARSEALTTFGARVDEALERAAGRISERARALEAHPGLWDAVESADARLSSKTVGDEDREDLHLPPQTDDVVEIARREPGAAPVRLQVLPKTEQALAPLDAPGFHVMPRGNRLYVSETRWMPARAPSVVAGAFAVSVPVDLSTASVRADALGWRAGLSWAGGQWPLSALPWRADSGGVLVPLRVPAGKDLQLRVEPAESAFLATGLGLDSVALFALSLAAAAVLWRRGSKPLAGGPAPGVSRRYRAVRRVGSGGMGEVWEGLALGSGGFQRKVAIKRLFPAREGDQRFLRMFLDEARIASALHHANIVAILDFGVSQGRPFQVLEWVEGADLLLLAERGAEAGQPMPVGVALHVCVQVAHALQCAHEAKDASGSTLNLVHRDVSPENVLLSWAGDVKLTDFGIAFAEGRLERTSEDMTKGKLTYMAPEQATRGTVDARSDLFSLGCVLHRLVVGKSPLADEDAMARVLSGQELELPPNLDSDVAAVLGKALRRSRFDRYETAAQMAQALGALISSRLAREPRLALQEWVSPLRSVNASPPDDTAAGWVLTADSD